MRKLVTITALLLGTGLAHAESNNQLLDCVEKASLTLDSAVLLNTSSKVMRFNALSKISLIWPMPILILQLPQ